MKRIITSYVNPDLDGFASALAISHFYNLLRIENSVNFHGNLDSQTMFLHEVAKDLHTKYQLNKPITEGDVVLVDTHHPELLHSSISLDDVVLIVDHHFDGKGESFPKSSIVNQKVGAATTIIYDTFLSEMNLPDYLSIVMCAAIYSNTLGFTAPATTERDRRAFTRLTEASKWDEKFEAKFNDVTKPNSLEGIIKSACQDIKTIKFKDREVSVLQFESHIEELDIFDLNNVKVLKKLVARELSCFICNIVDLSSKRSLVFASSNEFISIIGSFNSLSISAENYISAPVIQRKTNIMPAFFSE